MSFGSAIRFEVKDGGKGIFWQKEKPKQKPRKFGYKSKDMRHPIRRVEPEYIEEDSKQKVKPSKDFIKRNRDQYRKPQADEDDKENHQHLRESSGTGRPSLSTTIKPGTVTLTQEQLNSLLATVGKLNPGEANGMRISIDAEHNALQVETPRDNSDSAPHSSHSEAKDKNTTEEDVSVFSLAKGNKADLPQNSKGSGYNSEDKTGWGKGVRFDTARNEERQRTPDASLAPPSLVPLRHMTVAERKRLQWAREKEAEEQLQKEGKNAPWGRPGDKPLQKQPELDPKLKSDTQKESYNEKLRKAIDDIEAKYGSMLNPVEEEGNPKTKRAANKGREQGQNPVAAKERGNAESKADMLHVPGLDSSYGVATEKEGGKSLAGKRLEEDRGNTRPPKRPDRRDLRREREGERNEKKKRGSEKERERKEEARGRGGDRDREEQEGGVGWDLPSAAAASVSAAPAAMQTSLVIGQSEPDPTQFLSKKELEKKKWLEDLDRQRDEKRIQKEKEKEKARQGLDDTWADRFVSPSVRGSQPPPSQPQFQQSQQLTQLQQHPSSHTAATGVAPWERTESRTNYTAERDVMPPAAMRSAMTIGNVAPNTDKIQERQAEEKRQWLEELNKQREEQREARQRLKEQKRTASPDDTWATRFTQETRTLTVAPTTTFPYRVPVSSILESSGGGGGDVGYYQDSSLLASARRSGSAPQLPVNELFDEEPKTFLRGQNVHLDPVTRRELEEKRRKHLEYQTAIKAQMEEKEKKKREERELKWREEMEGERKLQAERDSLQRQLEAENSRNRQREEARQRQVEQLKSLIDAEQERAQGERMKKRLSTLQQAGHDITGLKAHYEAITPRYHQTSQDTVSVPGLLQSPHEGQGAGNSSHFPATYRASEEMDSLQASQELMYGGGGGGQGHGPYTENRMLTPTRYRGPGHHHHATSVSPQREFATQTDGDLNSRLRKVANEVEIEYKGPFHSTNAKAAGATKDINPVDNASGRPQPSKHKPQKQQKGKPGTWNYQNQDGKAAIKQSEKDLFYEQRKQESDERRAKRERQLQYLVELNKQVIPTERSTHPHPNSHYHHHNHHSDSDLLNGGGEESYVNGGGRSNNVGGHRTILTNGDLSHRSQSPPVNSMGGNYQPRHRSQSPPVPTVRRKTGHDQDLNHDLSYGYGVGGRGAGDRGGGDFSSPLLDERGSIQAPTRDTDFVPFLRTNDILAPSRADDPVELSRENTRIKQARQNYHENLMPATYGNQISMYRDSHRQPATTAAAARAKDPILNPGLVKDHPTARQDQILQQLSSLKQSLIQRQREIETCMSPSDLKK